MGAGALSLLPSLPLSDCVSVSLLTCCVHVCACVCTSVCDIAWAQRCDLVEATKRAERAVAELEEQARQRATELQEAKFDFVVAGVSEALAPEVEPSKPSGRGAQRATQARSSGGGGGSGGGGRVAGADRFDITPRGTGGIKIDKAASKVDRIRPPEVQVRVRVGSEISDADAKESQASMGSRARRGRSSSASPDGANRPHTPGSTMASLLRSMSPPEQLDGPEPAVWQGNNADAMEPGAGVAMRVGQELRRGPSLPKDPMRLTRREYLMSRLRDNETADTRPRAAPADSAGSSDEEEGRVEPPARERHWMDDARALDHPGDADEEEQRQLQEWQSKGRGRHYAFEAKILEAKAKSAWGESHEYRRPPVPVLPQKNSRNALLSQAASLSSQGATALQRSLRRVQQQQRQSPGSARSACSSPLGGFAARTGDVAARQVRLELASQALHQHVKSQVLTNRARVAPNPNSPTRAGTTRMAGLPIAGNRRLTSGGASAALTYTSRRASAGPRTGTPVMVLRA